MSSPCPKSWDELAGNNRIRYCSDCRLNVYNLAEMSPAEVRALVRQTSGRLCGRLYLRGDRTATVRDCPTYGKRILLRRAIGVSVVLLLAGFAWLFRGVPGPDRSALPSWARVVVDMIDPPSSSGSIQSEMGVIVCPTKPPAPPVPPPPTGGK